MKILMISTDRKIFEEGSAVRARMFEYGSIVQELHIVVFTAKEHDVHRQQIGNNVWIYPTHSKNKWRYIFDAIREGKQIIKANHSIETTKWLVTTQDPFETGLAGRLIARSLKLPLHLQLHTDIGSAYFRNESRLNKVRLVIARHILPKARGVRVVSKRIKRTLVDEYHLPSTKISVLPIFVDVKEIARTQEYTAMRDRYPQFDFIILMASRLTKEKNISLALEALRDIARACPKTGLIIVGDGSEREALELKTSDHGLWTNIVFEGWAEDLPSYYKMADLFLLTSNYEGYGLTLIEAAAAGCPILTTNVGVVGDMINKNNALVCEVGDRECLAKQMRFAIENKSLRARLSAEAQHSVSSLSSKQEYLLAYKKSWEDCF